MIRWLTDIAHLLGERLFGKTSQQPELNRKQRRDLARMKPGEVQMRRQRTYIAQSKRRSSKRGDHGAKSKRAFNAGVEQAVRYLNVRIQQAYVAGLTEGRKQTAWWVVPRSWLRKAA